MLLIASATASSRVPLAIGSYNADITVPIIVPQSTAHRIRCVNADQVWQSVLGQLQTEMPRASFDTWVRDTRVLSWEAGVLSIGVRNSYARDWLESRLLSTVAQLLAGMLNQKVDVRFVVTKDVDEIDDESGDGEVNSADANGEDKTDTNILQVQLAEANTRYAKEVQPDRIVAPYAYAFRLIWFGDVTPKQFSLWIGFRQAVFSIWKKAGKNIRNIPWQDVCQYANMARASFFREIGSLDLPNLVERIEISKEKTHFKDSKGHFRQIANLYRVHMDPPLVRADAAALLEILQLRSGITKEMPALDRIERALVALQSLQNEDVSCFLAKLPEGEEPLPEIKNYPGPTAMHVVHALTGLDDELPAGLQQAAEELHQRIISFAGKALITLYFLEKVARAFRLTHAQTWLLAQMRKKGFRDDVTGEVRDWIIVQGGYRTLARWAGISPTRKKTIWEWLRYTNFSVFVTEIEPSPDEPELQEDTNLRKDAERLLKEWDETDTRVFGIRLNEPLVSMLDGGSETPGVAEMRHGNGGDETPDMAQVRPGSGEDETLVNGASGTPVAAEVRLRLGASDTHFKFFKVLRPVLKDQKRTNQYDPDQNVSVDQWVAALAPKRWNLQRLFNNGHASLKKQKELATADPAAFVSWLLYAFSQNNLQNPFGYALSQLAIGPTIGAGGAFDELASYAPIELVKLAAATISGQSGSWAMAQTRFTEDALWDNTIGPTNPRIAHLFLILTGADHPSGSGKSYIKETTTISTTVDDAGEEE